MSNLADDIERFILQKLSDEDDAMIMLQRHEIAEEIDCAPSQVSYVLSTRFTVARGFIVESRRGSGGFVRIARIPLQHVVYQDIAKRITAETSAEEVLNLIGRLEQLEILTWREAELLRIFCRLIYQNNSPEVRAGILRSLFLRLDSL
jgi:transcriptional regulator CtsR